MRTARSAFYLQTFHSLLECGKLASASVLCDKFNKSKCQSRRRGRMRNALSICLFSLSIARTERRIAQFPQSECRIRKKGFPRVSREQMSSSHCLSITYSFRFISENRFVEQTTRASSRGVKVPNGVMCERRSLWKSGRKLSGAFVCLLSTSKRQRTKPGE
jgi:hypothetical protein